MMRFFLSHSKYDKDIVEKVWELLGPKAAWLDRVEIDSGEVILEKVENSIRQATDFVLFWSEDARNSEWVKLEVHMAFIRMLEQRGCILRVVDLDKTPMPLYLRVYKYIDVSENLENAPTEIAQKLISDASKPRGTIRRLFVNRHDELKRIEAAIEDVDTRVIVIHGMYGIGKRCLSDRAVEYFFTPPQVEGITVKPGIGWTELSLQLCALASIEAPQDGAPIDEIKSKARLAIEKLHSEGVIIAFYDIQSWTDEDGNITPPLDKLISWFSEISGTVRRPVFMTSTRIPRMSASESKLCQIIRINGLELDDVVSIVKRWLEIESGKIEIDSKKLKRICGELWGYPLGARLAASMVATYGADYLIEHHREVLNLRVDIAKELLSHVRLTSNGNLIIQALSAIDVPIPSTCLAKALKIKPDEFGEAIENALSFGLITVERLALTVHPLIRDFFWRRFSLRSDYLTILASLVSELRTYLIGLSVGSVEYAILLPSVFRLLALTGKLSLARSLRRDLHETLLAAAIQLYNRPKIKQTLELSLKYVDIVLEGDPENWQARLYRARCLYQLGHAGEAESILLKMKQERPNSCVVLHALGRVRMKEKDWEHALVFFRQALDGRVDYFPALRDSAECYMRLQDTPRAEQYMKRAKAINPADPYLLQVESLILEDQGLLNEAYSRMQLASEQEPESATFLHRLGRILEQKGNREPALEYYNKAVELDNEYTEALLSRVSILIDLGRLPDAEKGINDLKQKLPRPRQFIWRGIEAKLLFAKDDLDGALTAFRNNTDEASFGLRAKIEMRRAELCKSKGYTALCEQALETAQKHITQGREKYPDNREYAEIERQIKSFKCK